MLSDYITLSSKGQLVIPKRIREQAGWNAGDQLEVICFADKLELRKVEPVPEQPKASVVRELLGKYRTSAIGEQEEPDDVRKLRKSLHGKLDS